MTPSAPAKPKTTIKVKVRFPISPNGPFEAVEPRTATAGNIRRDAEAHFEITEDPQTHYQLRFEHSPVDDATVLGDLAHDANEIVFTLAKELTQGDR